MYRYLFPVALVLLATSCSNIPKYHGFIVEGVSFVNQTTMPLHDVTLSVEQTGGLVSCGFIPVGSDCSVSFPVRQYHGQPVRVRWQQAGENWDRGEFIVLPAKIDHPDQPVDVQVILNSGGNYRVYARQ